MVEDLNLLPITSCSTVDIYAHDYYLNSEALLRQCTPHALHNVFFILILCVHFTSDFILYDRNIFKAREMLIREIINVVFICKLKTKDGFYENVYFEKHT